VTSQTSILQASKRKFRLRVDGKFFMMFFAHLAWLGTLCLLVSWWGRLALRQAERIATLEGALGLADKGTQDHWHRIQRMLFWESGAFFALLLISSGLLFLLYWRDHIRARGVQAFFASVTHELRTPLTGIRLQAESIADHVESQGGDPKLSSNGHLITLSQRLLDDSMRLESQVDRTLELARVEGGGPVFTQPLQIKPWLDRFLKNWSRDYRGQVEVHSTAEDLWIQADPAAVQVIFKNLLENSVKHSKQDKVRVTISTLTHENGVSVQLMDNGQGYRGKAKSLGTLFQKGPSSQGTGVGLYLVQVLMQRMGGRARFALNNGLTGFGVELRFKEGETHE
jgi:signal transduction histidine kinase